MVSGAGEETGGAEAMHTDDLAEQLKERFMKVKEQRRAVIATSADLLDEMKRVRTAYYSLIDEAPSEGEMDDPPDAVEQVSARNAPVVNPTMTVNEIAESLCTLFAEKGVTPIESILEQLYEQADERGVSKRGLKLRIEKVLRDEFKATKKGWQ